MANAHVCATCGLPDTGKEGAKREGRVLCATCGQPLSNTVLAESLTERGVSSPPTLQAGDDQPTKRR